MNARVEPPPKRGMGCFAKGCLILIAFGILLVAAGIGGTFLSLRRIYLSDKPAPIPEASVPSAATPGETSVGTPSETSATVRERLDTIKSAARAHELLAHIVVDRPVGRAEALHGHVVTVPSSKRERGEI